GPDFDPSRTVLVKQTLNASGATNLNPGKVEFLSYAPKHLVLSAEAATQAILLLNDKFDSNWKARVDGKSSELLRCNYAMQGIQIGPGVHRVEFSFEPTLIGLYVNIVMSVTGLGLVAFLAFDKRNRNRPEAV